MDLDAFRSCFFCGFSWGCPRGMVETRDPWIVRLTAIMRLAYHDLALAITMMTTTT